MELLALNGGLAVALACMQLGAAAGVLALGAGGWWHTVLLLLWLAVTLGIIWQYRWGGGL